jgi:hypothetical protein
MKDIVEAIAVFVERVIGERVTELAAVHPHCDLRTVVDVDRLPE